MKLTGTWIGQYTYGDCYQEEGIAGKSVPFTMSLTETWLGRIKGYVRDDASRGGQPERGRISGRRKGRRLSFMKIMPTGYVVEDGEFVDRREHLADALDAEELDNLPPHRIHYEGDIDDHGETVAGAWNIVAWDDAADDDDVARGTWSARRASYEPDAV